MIPLDLKYTKSHEWVRVEGEFATIGITSFALGLLGDLTFVDLPVPGQTLVAGDVFGAVESVKAVTDLYTPVGGQVMECNNSLPEHLVWLSNDPFGQGWMFRLRLAELPAPIPLLTPHEYEAHCASA